MKIIKALFSRTVLIVLAAVLELLLFLTVLKFLEDKLTWIEAVLRIIGGCIAVFILSTSKHLSFDAMWVFLILVMPVTGTAFYLLLGAGLLTSRTTKALVKTENDAKKYYVQDEDVYDQACREYPAKAGAFHYIAKKAGFPVCRNSTYNYYPFGQDGYPVMLEELKKAEKFIFLEYFIIEEGEMWNGIHAILKQKAEEGLDVRVLYDDIGSFNTLSAHYAKTLEQEGIKAIPFNRVNPFLSTIMNHRDHRKILVIDGLTAFTGGVNLADEYINVKEKYGVWKDNMVRVRGEAVWTFTVMFLTHWDAFRKEDPDYTVFKAENTEPAAEGYVAAYGETPLDDQILAQDIYINIINNSRKYCWIMTPYLIIDNEMVNALILAASRGVDVRIITPGIPDKKIVFDITRSFYKELIDGGVKIFEYSPGFVHAKVFVSDDLTATVGTINLDYRSLYLHFENGTYLCGCKAVMDIKADFTKTFAQCREIQKGTIHANFFKMSGVAFVKLFAAQM